MEKAVDFTRLEKNIIEVIQEEQIKLGYRSELIRLYYPITSLNRFFHTDAAWLHDRRAFTAVSQIFRSCTCRTDDTRGI